MRLQQRVWYEVRGREDALGGQQVDCEPLFFSFLLENAVELEVLGAHLILT